MCVRTEEVGVGVVSREGRPQPQMITTLRRVLRASGRGASPSSFPVSSFADTTSNDYRPLRSPDAPAEGGERRDVKLHASFVT